MESSDKGQSAESINAAPDGRMETNDHDELINRLKEQRKKLEQGGGAKRIDAQHAKGKKTVRERLLALLDEGSFQELDPFMQNRQADLADQRFLGDGLVAGFGKINGRRVCIYGQDFTVMGGSTGEVAGIKMAKIMDLAMKAGVPVIGINDGGGARIQEGIYSLAAYGELFYRNTQASGVIPQISVIMGPCAGGAVYSPALTDFVIMTSNISNMFITGPEVIKSVTGEEVDVETLGGAATHNSVSGVASLVGANEEETFGLVRSLLAYLPDNNTERPSFVDTGDSPYRQDPALDAIVPTDANLTYDMRQVILRIMDQNTFFEVFGSYAPNAIVGFARLNGQSVGVVANEPDHVAGVLDINASDKIARFVRFCDAFNIPLVTFVDTPGFMPGTVQEHGGIIRHGAKIVYAYSEATVPKVAVVTRKGYGGAYIVMSSKHIHGDMLFAWPTAEIAVMGADGAVNILYGKEIKTKSAEEAADFRAQKVSEYREKFANPYAAAASGFVDDVILPSETRPRLIAALELLRDKQATGMPKKHGNMPL
jgi:acetyl-CoA carboxylase carboxyltransferase component